MAHTTSAGGVILNDVATGDSDEVLVGRTLAGDSTAYSVLVRRYRRAALVRALSVVGDEFDAEDVAQESFVQAYDLLATCRDPSRFGAWLLTIVRRGALNRLRTIRRRRAAPLEPSLAADVDPKAGQRARDSASAHSERQELRGQLLAALAQLSPAQREVVLLADLEDWSHAEIADKTGLSVTMSRRHLSDARRRLRGLLGGVE